MPAQQKCNIDYIGVLKYLRDNQNIPYSDPEKVTDPSEKARLLEVKAKGQKIVGEIKKMVEACNEKYNLHQYQAIAWLNAARERKTRKYLWAQMKYENFKKDPSSISIFVEKHSENITKFRISLELKNEDTPQETVDRYHSYLDLPIDSSTGLVLVKGSNEEGTPPLIENETRETVKAKLKSGEYPKVQICKYINRKPDETNEYFHEELLKAVGLLLPYYEYQLGIKSGKKNILTKLPENEENIKMNKTKTIGLNTILYGPPGTGKTYHSAIYAVAICDKKPIEELTDYEKVMERYNVLKAEKRIAFTTFHQSYGYEEFIEGIKPVIEAKETESETSEAKKSDIGYKIEPGVFKKFCEKAKGDAQPYVFIIDEINRGNISKIFGELITLIETTKRDGMGAEAADAILPYSGEAFSVPSNVYILGTMNTADRSIALMDTALRRRFNFEEMMPDPSVIDGIKVESLDVATMLRTINTRIEYLYDREHTIGHAFFTKLKDNSKLEVLAEIFRNNVVPLLQEYFYEDYEKIQLVLGDNDKSSDSYKFILDKKVNENEIFKKSPQLDLHEKTYVIQEDAFYNLQSYLEISEVRKAEEQSE